MIGHNIIQYDLLWLTRLLNLGTKGKKVTDTLVLSHLLRYDLQDGHSLAAWGERLGLAKVGLDMDFSTFSLEMLARCERDVEINYKLYELLKYKILDRPEFKDAIETEHQMAAICLDMHVNGFKFNLPVAVALRDELTDQLAKLDAEIVTAFPPKLRFIREYTPKETKHGTISRTSVPRDWEDLSTLSVGAPFSVVLRESFNPGSTKQIVERLTDAGWRPTDKTASGLSYKVNEVNLSTLPDTAPAGAHKLVERLLVAGRWRTLNEWINCCRIKIPIENDVQIGNGATSISKKFVPMIETANDSNVTELARKSLLKLGLDNAIVAEFVERKRNLWSITATEQGRCVDLYVNTAIQELGFTNDHLQLPSITSRIHGRFNPIGTTTHRMSHKSPNLGNVAAPKSIKYNGKYLKAKATALGSRMRSLWVTSDGWWLVGTDMDGAHLRIFGHLINDQTYIRALVDGDKDKGTDLHSVNKRSLGDVCVDRDRAKTFIFSFFNGAGSNKVSEIFACALDVAKETLDRFTRAYPGLLDLKRKVFPSNASRGYFKGIDGRLIVCDSAHLMMGAVLQNTEAVIMKRANILWRRRLDQLGINYRQVNLVHDEFVTEVEGDMFTALRVGSIQRAAIALVGKQFKLHCPLIGTTKVGKTWLDVH